MSRQWSGASAAEESVDQITLRVLVFWSPHFGHSAIRLLSVGVLLYPDSSLAWAEETLGFWLAVWKDNDDIWQQLELKISYQMSQKLMCAQLWSAVSLLPESPSRHLCPGCPSPPQNISHLHPHALSSLAEEGTILPLLLAKSTGHFLSPWTQLRFLTVNLCWRWPFWIDTPV